MQIVNVFVYLLQIFSISLFYPMKKKIFITLWIVLLVALLWVWWFFAYKIYWGNVKYTSDWKVHVVSSLLDKINADTMWCWTFQIVWNEMLDNIETDVVFAPQLQEAENLNKKTFTKEQLSEDSYYVKSALMTKEVKTEIENWIKEKFNETSDILDKLNRKNVPETEEWYIWKDKQTYIFYTMLKKIFKFAQAFDKLDPEPFDDKYENIKYFWIKSSSSSSLYSQVDVLYYNSEDDFAVSLTTNEWENVILSRWTNKDTFMNTYNAIKEKSKIYRWERNFWKYDYLKVPNLSLDELREYGEFKNKIFIAANGDECEITEALQTIQFDLDEEGWKIKSEAVIVMDRSNSIADISFEKPDYRYFYFNKPFTIFLQESNKELPYFAAQISDITLFQK